MRIANYFKGNAWVAICLFNLMMVACLGLLMRLNILFTLTWLNQVFTLHAHSHFAFSGWISQALMLCISLAVTGRSFNETLPAKYNRLLIFNLFCSYGMLISFLAQGYAAVSIFFSTASLVVSFIFYAFCRKDVTTIQRRQVWWKYMQLATIFSMVSALGTLSLAYTMVKQPENIELRLSSVYFYLHFQYNGWFFFAGMGLFHYWLAARNIALPASHTIFRLLAVCTVPTYLLSINWLPFPQYLHAFAILFAAVQLCAWGIFAVSLLRSRRAIAAQLAPISRLLLSAVLLAASIKFALQTASSVPSVARLAFGLRPVVIAYLHLVLLGMISLFLIGWFYQHSALGRETYNPKGVRIFLAGVIANEFFLMVQGLSALSGYYVGMMPESLAVAGLLLVFGSLQMVTRFLPTGFRHNLWPATTRHSTRKTPSSPTLMHLKKRLSLLHQACSRRR